jgi:hypothetical protein
MRANTTEIGFGIIIGVMLMTCIGAIILAKARRDDAASYMEQPKCYIDVNERLPNGSILRGRIPTDCPKAGQDAK